jgi:processive 1,2-diacylglycerol beta-glucosyltransferase
MKFLILSCSTGEGHNSAAGALQEYFNIFNVESQIVDTLSLVNSDVSKTASDIYLFSTKTKMFRFLYNAGEIVRNPKLKSPVYLANRLYCGKLLDFITKNAFDAVICVHLFPAEAITALKRAGKLKIKTMFLMTDYTCIPFMEETKLDYYIVPHEHLIEECVSKGIPREKLYPYGIPVKSHFYERSPKEYARAKCRTLFGGGDGAGCQDSSVRLDESLVWMLVMSGSMGYGNVKTLVEKIVAEKTPKEVIIVCGNNAKLQKTLSKEYLSAPGVTVIGFTDKIGVLMDACDVLFTKPGGLSSTEAAAKNIPVIHTAPIPGCETHNALFFHYHGMSYSTTDIDEQVREAVRLCLDEGYKKRMLLSQKMNINTFTGRDILTLLCK